MQYTDPPSRYCCQHRSSRTTQLPFRSYYFQTRKNMNPMCGERVLLAAMRDRSSRLVQTGSPNVVCSLLPEHWRINKALPATFRVVALSAVPDGTEVKLVAGNDENLSGELINSSTTMHDQIARFTDLRFISRSGRGKTFNLVITICSQPYQVAVYRNAIKITADGPRGTRPKMNYRSGLGRGTKRSRCDTDSLDDKSGSNWDASASSSSTCSMTREKTARRSTRAGQVRQVKSDDGRDHRPEPDVGSPSLLQRFIEAVDERQITEYDESRLCTDTSRRSSFSLESTMIDVQRKIPNSTKSVESKQDRVTLKMATGNDSSNRYACTSAAGNQLKSRQSPRSSLLQRIDGDTTCNGAKSGTYGAENHLSGVAYRSLPSALTLPILDSFAIYRFTTSSPLEVTGTTDICNHRRHHVSVSGNEFPVRFPIDLLALDYERATHFTRCCDTVF